MAGLCEGGNEPSGSLKAICKNRTREVEQLSAMARRSIVVLARSETTTNSASYLSQSRARTERRWRWPNKQQRLWQWGTGECQHEIGDGEMVFGEVRLRIRQELPDIRLTVRKNLRKSLYCIRLECYLGGRREKRPLGRPRRKWKDDIKMDMRELRMIVGTGLILIRIGSDGGLM
ncbi:hypothetical protein ANN_12566 [Periplaneta americana]|uniref:Uncharacterized protein n=1 Tax=Periplaneta americana TaxID=6978 RepID=A0ABQ8TIB7_PERAM|nr:hypothetical protein ANN_12566 [Periplaneta americana]